MRVPYTYPKDEEPLFEVQQAIELDDYREEKQRKKMSLPLITKYRPEVFEEVIGNELCIKALAEAMKGDAHPHAFLFTGPTGVGKTTLARIIAKEVNAFIQEMDAASNSGVDDTRRLVENSCFPSLVIPGQKNRMIIVDECHNLSDKAWEPLLKPIEEPPLFLYWALCTTEPEAVKLTVKKGRCYPVALKPLKARDIEKLLTLVCEVEKWTVVDDVFNAIVQAADGSARNALSILQAGHAVKSRDDLSQIIVEVESDNSPAAALGVYLAKGGRDWGMITKMLGNIEDFTAAHSHILNILTSSLSRSKDTENAQQIWKLLRSISETNGSWNKKVQLYSGIGQVLWGN
jgi:replication-associated recombination protein RarA